MVGSYLWVNEKFVQSVRMADEVCYTRMFSGGLFVCLFAVYLGFFKNIFVNAKLDKPLPTTPMASAFAGVIHQI